MSATILAPVVDRVESDPALPAQADVVVIGGGIMGVTAAYFLAKKRLRVAVVEKGHVAGEQSSRNWGWCRTQGKPLVKVPLSKASLSIWDGLSAELGIDTGFKRSGVLLVTQDPAELAGWEKWTDDARDFQIPGQLLTPDQVQERAPSATRWIGGWYSPTDGRAEPTRAAPAIARGARALGATLHQNCAARGLETKGGAVSGVITERGVIRTSAVLCAGGAWASMFCRRHGIPFPQAGVYASVCRTEAVPGLTDGAIGSDGFSVRRRDDGGFTVAMRLRGRVDLTPQGLLYARQFLPMLAKRRKHVTFGLGRSAVQGPGALARWSFDGLSPFERVRVLDPAPDMGLVERTMAQLRAAFPAVGDLKVAQAWGGLIDWTPDATPVISPVEVLPGFYLAAGLSGVGFGLGPGAGRLAADLVAGDTPIVDPAPYRHARLVDGSRLHVAKLS